MSTNAEQTNKWLAFGFLRSKFILSSAVSRIQLEDFREDETPLKLIYKLSKEYFDKHKDTPPFIFIESMAKDEVIPNWGIPAHHLRQFLQLVEFAYSANVGSDNLDSLITDKLSEFLSSHKVMPVLHKLIDGKTVLEQNALADITKVISDNQIVKAQALNPFSGSLPMTHTEKRQPWGCDFLDAITGGSLRGETALMLAPSGGGKTLANIQIALDSAFTGEHSIILSYEQAAHPGLTYRMYSYALGRDIGFFANATPESLQKDSSLMRQWEEVREKLGKNVHVFDMLELSKKGGANGGPDDLRSVIKQVQDLTGKNPRYVGLDWYGPYIENYMSRMENTGKGRKTDTKAGFMHRGADEIRRVGMEMNVNIFIFHQLGTQGASRKPSELPSATDSFECKSLHQFMDMAFAISNRDMTSNIAQCVILKNRNGVPFSKCGLRMEGAKSRFVYLEADEFRVHDGGILDLSDAKYSNRGGGSTDLFDPSPSKPKVKLTTASMKNLL